MFLRSCLGYPAALFLGVAGLGCGGADAPPRSADECRDGPADDVEMGAKTAGQAVEAGAETGVAGVKQFGRSVGGLLEDGSEGAEEEWEEGKKETKAEAREGRDEVREAASVPRCP